MPVDYPNITLGTAGHIDHGKTALVKLLTGCDTDRLKAEKERGMSIDLGFAPATVGGMQVGIVDVPGHENFIKTMVAGASGIDGCILVVAADDGVMPQTREHLDIISLLGVRHGVVVLTKIDRVDSDHLALVRAEIKESLASTFLADAAIAAVCNLTGEGFEAFYEALEDMLRRIRPRTTQGVFRLPVERAFSVKGYGTVVAGIPVSGEARIGDELALLPHEMKGRISRIEVYGRPGELAVAGQCAAINVRQWDHRHIKRGDTVATPGYFSSHRWYACRLYLLPYAKVSLRTGARVLLHTGTSEVTAAVYLMEGEQIGAGQECLAQVKLEAPLVAGPRDRFIMRSLSPVQTVGGGMIIEAIPRRLKRTRPEVREDLEERSRAVLRLKDFVDYCLKTAGPPVVRAADISSRTKVPAEQLSAILDEIVAEGKAITLATDLYVCAETASRLSQNLLSLVARHHLDSPESPGVAPGQLLAASALEKTLFEGLIALLEADGKLVRRGSRLALPEHRVALAEEDRKLLATVEEVFRAQPFHPPGMEEAAQRTGASMQKAQWAFRTLIEQEVLVEVAKHLLFHREAVERAREILVSHIRGEKRLESVKFKYLLDTTRKFAIPLLDYFDRVGVTLRVGNTRYLRGRDATDPEA